MFFITGRYFYGMKTAVYRTIFSSGTRFTILPYQTNPMEKIKKQPFQLSRQQVDLVLITTFFIGAILITIIFKINENASFHSHLTHR